MSRMLVYSLILLAIALVVHWLARRRGRGRDSGELRDSPGAWHPITAERRILGSLPMVLWEWDLDEGRYTYVGKSAEALFGYPMAQWYESKLWRDSLYPDDIEGVERSFMRAIWSGGVGTYYYRVVHADGRLIEVESQIVSILEHGKPRYVRGMTHPLLRGS